MASEPRPDDPLASWRRVAEDGSFEERLASLDEIVSWLEAGQHTLDQAVTAYELGVIIGQRCEETIAGAELRVRQIDVDAAALGKAVSGNTPLDDHGDDESATDGEDFPF